MLNQGNAIGIIEVRGYSNAVLSYKAATDAASLEVLAFDERFGGQLVTILIRSETSAVDAALDAVRQAESKSGMSFIRALINIGNPHTEVMRLIDAESKNGREKSISIEID